jgi:hypothetical protein
MRHLKNMVRTEWKHPRHITHYYWNRSRFNSNYEPFVCSCSCCCIWCEKEA